MPERRCVVAQMSVEGNRAMTQVVISPPRHYYRRESRAECSAKNDVVRGPRLGLTRLSSAQSHTEGLLSGKITEKMSDSLGSKRAAHISFGSNLLLMSGGI